MKNTKAPVKAPAKAAKKAKVIIPKHKLAVKEPAYRKQIVRSVQGKATSVRDEQGKKDNRKHIVKFMKGKSERKELMRIIYGRELIAHTEKNITELTNSKGSVYYFIPVAE